MKLEHITHKICPTCGSHAISEEKDNQHCSGEWNESRRFKCGCIVKYSPNFRSESVSSECPKDPKEVEKSEKRKLAKGKLRKYIKRLDVDDSFKNRLSSDLDSYYLK